MTDYFTLAQALAEEKKSYCWMKANLNRVSLKHCQKQCPACQDYQDMKQPAHYPVPAIYTGVDVFLVDYSMRLIKEFFEELWT